MRETNEINVDEVVESLKSDSLIQRWWATCALGKMGERGFKPLIQALQHSDELVRIAAMVQLKKYASQKTIEAVLAALGDESWAVRGLAAGTLGNIGDKRAVESLLAVLDDEEMNVQEYAAESLGKLGDKRAISKLIARVESNGNSAVITALGEIGDARAVPNLITILRKQREYILNTYARKALGKIGMPAIAPLLKLVRDGEKNDQQQAILALGETGHQNVVDILIEYLENRTLASYAASALEMLIGKQAIPYVIKAMQEKLFFSVELVKKFQDKRFVPILIDNIFWGHWCDIGDEVLEALIEIIGKEETVDALVQALFEDRENYPDIMHALEKLGDNSAVEPLLAILNQSSLWTRFTMWFRQFAFYFTLNLHVTTGLNIVWNWFPDSIIKSNHRIIEKKKRVIKTLGQLGDKRALIPLVKCLNSDESRIRNAAAIALGRLGKEQAVEPLVKSLKNHSQSLVATFFGLVFGNAFKKMYLEIWDADNLPAIPNALGEINDKRAVEPLIWALMFNEGPAGVAHALGKLGDRRAVPPLIKRYSWAEYWLKSDIIKALGILGGERTFHFLVTVLKLDDVKLRRCAAEALGMMGNKRALEPLKKSLGNLPGGYDRNTAISAITKLGGFETLKSIYDNCLNNEIKEDLYKPLESECFRRIRDGENATAILDDEVKFLENILRGTNRYWQVHKFKEIDPKISVPPLCKILCDYDLVEKEGKSLVLFHRYVARVLGEIGCLDAVPYLHKALTDSHGSVRQSALRALERLAA